MSANYTKLLQIAYPGKSWTLYDATLFDTLEWDAELNAEPKPTLGELLAKFEVQKAIEGMRMLRMKRDQLLAKTDPYGLADYPFPSESAKQAWMNYRQELRDITRNAAVTLTDSFDLDDTLVSWPEKPIF